MQQVTIGGEPITLGDFMAFKAVYAMEIAAEVETVVRELVHEAGDFRQEYARRHYVEMPRNEARRQYRPRPLMRQVAGDDDDVIIEPVLNDAGEALLGPDPLGHLTDADWQASGQVLRIPEEPDENAVMAALVPKAFGAAQRHVLRLLALVVVTNAQLEEWDGNEDIAAKLDAKGRELLHRCKAEELIGLAVAAVKIAREQVAGPFVDARAELSGLFKPREATTTERAPEPMRVVPETPSSPTSSTASPDGTGGTPEPSSTAPAGVSS